MIDLEHELRDLGAHLDHPAGEQIVPQLRERLTSPVAPTAVRPTSRRVVRRRRTLAALGAVAAVLLLAVSLPASRHAIAEVFGLDSTPAEQPDRGALPHHHDSTVTSGPPAPEIELLDLASARGAVDFPIRVPAGFEPTTPVTVDHRVPGGLVSLNYPEFRLVEVASPPDVTAELAELLPPTSRVRVVSVRNRPGLWITGTHHEIAYRDREGVLRHEPSRATGHVLLWEEGGVTYRIEGFEHQASAHGIARAIG